MAWCSLLSRTNIFFFLFVRKKEQPLHNTRRYQNKNEKNVPTGLEKILRHIANIKTFITYQQHHYNGIIKTNARNWKKEGRRGGGSMIKQNWTLGEKWCKFRWKRWKYQVWCVTCEENVHRKKIIR